MFRSKTCHFRDTRLSKIRNTRNDPIIIWNIWLQVYPVYTEYSSPRPKFHSVSLYDRPFLRYNIIENRKCTQWPQNDLMNLTVKSTLYTLNAHPEAQISLRFALHVQPAVFEIQGPNFTRFTLRSAVFEIQCCRKSEMHWMTPKWH